MDTKLEDHFERNLDHLDSKVRDIVSNSGLYIFENRYYSVQAVHTKWKTLSHIRSKTVSLKRFY